jgi:linoleoyl-CoA desaturase
MLDRIPFVAPFSAAQQSRIATQTETVPGETGVEPGHRPKFPKDTGFHAEVLRRVGAYFRATGYHERDCWQMYLKTVIILAWCVTAYWLLVFVADTWWQGLLAAFAMSLGMGAIGFSIQHDGGHSAYSKRRWINKLAACSLDLMGASSYLWYWKHHIFHHTYSNISGQDTDIELGAILRVSPHQRRRSFHRWQHFYLWPLYGLMSGRWHLYGDFKDYFTGRIGPHPFPRPKMLEQGVFWVGKVASVMLMLVVPMFFHPIWLVALFYMIVTGALGIIMSIVFQLAHCVEEADFPLAVPGTRRMENSWAVHQAETTVDFARQSKILSWYLGGLNFQIEHHLFPHVCHIHYPAISSIVETTCKDYGVKYAVHPTFWAGIVSHYRWLKRMGQPVAA